MGVACKKQGPVMVKAAIAALLVLLIFLAVVKAHGRWLKPAAKTTALQADPSLADISAVGC